MKNKFEFKIKDQINGKSISKSEIEALKAAIAADLPLAVDFCDGEVIIFPTHADAGHFALTGGGEGEDDGASYWGKDPQSNWDVIGRRGWYQLMVRDDRGDWRAAWAVMPADNKKQAIRSIMEHQWQMALSGYYSKFANSWDYMAASDLAAILEEDLLDLEGEDKNALGLNAAQIREILEK